MSLTPCVTDQIWLRPYPVRLAGTRFDARMTMIRLASGALVLHSPCSVDAALADELAALGPVEHIVAPGNFHTLHTATAQAAFPRATTWICPGIERRRPHLKYDGILGDAAPAAWAGEMDQAVVAGRIMREVAMFHRASRTLLLVDLIENFTDATPGVGGMLKFLFKHVLGMWNNPRPAPEYRFGWSDPDAARAALRRILAWDFERIVVAHGDVIESGAHELARKAWSGIMDD